LVEIGVSGRQPQDWLNSAIDQAFAAVEQIHALISYHEPDSDLSRLNRHALAGWHQVDPHTFLVIEAALHFASISDGAFDPTVGPRLEAWGYLPPSESPADAAATWRDVEVGQGGRVRFARPLRLDLGGIAKGYAVDFAVATLTSLGVEGMVVNAGGDLRTAGPIPLQVRLRHPTDPLRMAHGVDLHNEALATSATYFSSRHRRGRSVSALVDPRNGEPFVGEASVSVRARDCMTADALTKVVLLAEAAIAERALEEFKARADVLQMPGMRRVSQFVIPDG
jgi:thiamine biosynthesis lipoprotein